MMGVEKHYLRACIKALCYARSELLELSSSHAIDNIPNWGKGDSLYLDAVPENAIIYTLRDEFDTYLPIITEEIGCTTNLRGSEEEVVCFSDPMDRSKILTESLMKHEGNLKVLFSDKNFIQEWEKSYGGDVMLSGPYGSITAIRHNKILFSTMINYITGIIYIAYEHDIGSISIRKIFVDKHQTIIRRSKEIFDKLLKPISFSSTETMESKKKITTVTYCQGEKYQQNLVNSKLFNDKAFQEINKENLFYNIPGGPARILYLINPPKVGFILSNGEKITEWLGWLAFVRYSKSNLCAYEISFDSSWTRDGILMAPSNTYSILGDTTDYSGGRARKYVEINLHKLKFLDNPTQYRSTILVCHSSNEIIQAKLRLDMHPKLIF